MRHAPSRPPCPWPPPIGNSADPDATAADRCAPLACERECEVAGGRPLVQGRFQTLSADEATEATMSNFGAPIHHINEQQSLFVTVSPSTCSRASAPPFIFSSDSSTSGCPVPRRKRKRSGAKRARDGESPRLGVSRRLCPVASSEVVSASRAPIPPLSRDPCAPMPQKAAHEAHSAQIGEAGASGGSAARCGLTASSGLVQPAAPSAAMLAPGTRVRGTYPGSEAL